MSAPPNQTPKKVVIEEDLDDLDDVLDQFNKAPSKSAPAAPPPTAAPTNNNTSFGPVPPPPAANATSNPNDDDLDVDEFTKELQRGMEQLMAELGGPAAASAAPGSVEQDQMFKKAWEQMLVEGMNGMGVDLEGEEFSGAKTTESAKSKGKAPEKASSAPGPSNEDFQKTIKAAMEKLKSSEADLNQASGNTETDPLAALLAQLGNDPNLGAEESEEDMAKMLETMMSALMGKEVLYEPLKELKEKFPEYLKENADKVSAEDKARYNSQQEVINKVISIFESPNYDESKDMSTITELMTEMQSLGAPPKELMGDMPPGLSLGADGMPELPEGCVIM